MNCPNCRGELASAGTEPNGGYLVQHYICLVCQREYVQEIIGQFKNQLSELVETREVEPDLVPELEEE